MFVFAIEPPRCLIGNPPREGARPCKGLGAPLESTAEAVGCLAWGDFGAEVVKDCDRGRM